MGADYRVLFLGPAGSRAACRIGSAPSRSRSRKPEPEKIRGRLVACTSPQSGSPRARTDICLVGITAEPGSTRAKSLPQPGSAETQKSAIFVGPGSPHASKH